MNNHLPDESDLADESTDDGRLSERAVNWIPGTTILPPPTVRSLVLLGVVMLGLVGLISFGVAGYVGYSARRLAEPFNQAMPSPTTVDKETQIARALPEACYASKDSAVATSQILRQRALGVVYSSGHRAAAIELGAGFAASVIVLGIFGLISLASLALIAKTGIADANGHLVAIFLISAAIALFYQGFFGVFQQKSNIDKNIQLAVGFGQIVEEIDSYCASGKVAVVDPAPYMLSLAKAMPVPTPSPGSSPTPTPKPQIDRFYAEVDAATFIAYIDWQMRTLGKFSFLLDEKQISVFTDAKRLSLQGL